MAKSCLDGYLTEGCKTCPDWADGSDDRGLGCACHFPIMHCPHFAKMCEEEEAQGQADEAKGSKPMKTMTELENIIMNRTICDRATANLIANDILDVAERDFAADIRREAAKEIFGEIYHILSVNSDGWATLDVRELYAIEKKYTERAAVPVEDEDVLRLRKGAPVWYVYLDTSEIETGKIFSVSFGEDGKLDSFSIDFDCGDFDEFPGSAFGVSVFTSEVKAEQAAIKARLSIPMACKTRRRYRQPSL